MPYADPERQREYMRKWIAQRRADWFADKVCAWCGSTDRLQLDHIETGQKVSHRIWSWSAARREAELAKCQVLCRGCHEAKTAEDVRPPHGSNSRYTSTRWPCRCPACRKAHALVNAQYRTKGN